MNITVMQKTGLFFSRKNVYEKKMLMLLIKLLHVSCSIFNCFVQLVKLVARVILYSIILFNRFLEDLNQV
jgi:hypothetical protein